MLFSHHFHHCLLSSTTFRDELESASFPHLPHFSLSAHCFVFGSLTPNILSTGEWRLSCRNNPLVIPVNHDLSVAFYHTKAIVVMFSSRLVAISGVGLRSFQSFDPITISGCQSNEIYNPTGQRWVKEKGKWNTSAPWSMLHLRVSQRKKMHSVKQPYGQNLYFTVKLSSQFYLCSSESQICLRAKFNTYCQYNPTLTTFLFQNGDTCSRQFNSCQKSVNPITTVTQRKLGPHRKFNFWLSFHFSPDMQKLMYINK